MHILQKPLNVAVTEGPMNNKMGTKETGSAAVIFPRQGAGEHQSRRTGSGNRHGLPEKVAAGKTLLESSLSPLGTQFPMVRSIFAKVHYLISSTLRLNKKDVTEECMS